jgi:predicted transcriptional regulator
MARTPQDVTDAELGVLQVLWDKGPSTRRQLTDVLYPRGGPAHYTTVQKLLQRLEAKGYVSVDRSTDVLTFAASVGREELISRRLKAVALKLCDGSLTPLLTNLIQAQKYSLRELDELREWIDRLSEENKTRAKRR